MKKIIIYCKELCQRYESVKEASIALNINVKSITMCVNGKRKKAGGYTFITYSNMVTDDSNNNIADTEYLGCLLLVFQAFTAYRNNACKMRSFNSVSSFIRILALG